MINGIYTKKALVMEILSYVIEIAALIVTIVFIIIGPEEIPTRYDFEGNIEDFGSPAVMLIMPLVMMGCNLAISLSMHLVPPSRWNMPMKIKPGREVLAYRDSVNMTMALSMICSCYSLVFCILMAVEAGGTMILASTMGFTTVLFAVIIVKLGDIKRHNR